MSLISLWAVLRALPGRVLACGAGAVALLLMWRARLRTRAIAEVEHQARGRALETLRRIEDAKRSASAGGGSWHQRLRRARQR